MANTAQPKENVLFWVMAPPKKTLEELKNEAITELERRGYDVRGKTPAQIRQMLRARPPKAKSSANSSRSKLDR
jgi:hypothetical protein